MPAGITALAFPPDLALAQDLGIGPSSWTPSQRDGVTMMEPVRVEFVGAVGVRILASVWTRVFCETSEGIRRNVQPI